VETEWIQLTTLPGLVSIQLSSSLTWAAVISAQMKPASSTNDRIFILDSITYSMTNMYLNTDAVANSHQRANVGRHLSGAADHDYIGLAL
jgi:hypothetical protein